MLIRPDQHPIVGDDLYGPAYEEGATHAAGRLLLHAHVLALHLPGEATRTEIEAPLPADFARPSRPLS